MSRSFIPFSALLFLLAALTGCESVDLTPVCNSATAQPNRVSVVFKAEESDSGRPVTELKNYIDKIVIEDGGRETGAESGEWMLESVQDLAIRVTIVLDASGSLAGKGPRVAAAVRRFVESAMSNRPGHASLVVDLYQFKGGDLHRLYPPRFDDEERMRTWETNRERALNRLTYWQYDDAEVARRLAAAHDRDKKLLFGALKEFQPSKGSSSAVYQAVIEGLKKARTEPEFYNHSLPDDLPKISFRKAPFRPTVVSHVALFLTDGHDEATSGPHVKKLRSRALGAARTFKTFSENQIFVAAFEGSHRGRRIRPDEGFLKAVASKGSFEKNDLAKLGALTATFGDFADELTAQSRKYYRLNLCSSRRSGWVHAHARLESGGMFKKSPEFRFSYNSEGFTDPDSDPRSEFSCDPRKSDQFPRCRVASVKSGGLCTQEYYWRDSSTVEAGVSDDGFGIGTTRDEACEAARNKVETAGMERECSMQGTRYPGRSFVGRLGEIQAECHGCRYEVTLDWWECQAMGRATCHHWVKSCAPR